MVNKSFGPSRSDFGTVPKSKTPKKTSRRLGGPLPVDRDGGAAGKGKGKAVEDGKEVEREERKGKRKMVHLSEEGAKLQSLHPPLVDPPSNRRSRPLSAFARPSAPDVTFAGPSRERDEDALEPAKKRTRPLQRLSVDPTASTAMRLLVQAAKTPGQTIMVDRAGETSQRGLKRLVAPPVALAAAAGPSRSKPTTTARDTTTANELSSLAPALLSATPQPLPPEDRKPLPLPPSLPPSTALPPAPPPGHSNPLPLGVPALVAGVTTGPASLEDLLSPRKKRRPATTTTAGGKMPFGLAERAEAVIDRAKSEWGMWRSDVARSAAGGEDGDGVLLQVEELQWTGGSGKALIARCRVLGTDVEAGEATSGLVFFSIHLAPSSSSTRRHPVNSARKREEGEGTRKKAVATPLELAKEIKVGATVWGEEPWSVVELDSSDEGGTARRALLLTRFGAL